jgi:hypothetical protein
MAARAPDPLQLRLPLDDVAGDGLVRLGETDEFGSLLLRLLELDGWEVATGLPAFAGAGVLVIARKGPFEVKRTAPRLADIATDVFVEARSLRGRL